MEEIVKIPTEDGKTIYGALNYEGKRKSKLIIFLHGITGNKDEHQYFLAPKYFNPKGYDTFRFNFYSDEKDARKLQECSVTTHVKDVALILNYFEAYEKMYLVAHSLGCLVALRTEHKNIRRRVLWSPTKGIQSLEQKNITHDEQTGAYIWNRFMNIEIGEEMIHEWTEAAKILPYIEKTKENDAFIFLGNCVNHKAWEPHIENHDVIYVEGSSHRMIEEGKLEEVYEETLKLLEN